MKTEKEKEDMQVKINELKVMRMFCLLNLH